MAYQQGYSTYSTGYVNTANVAITGAVGGAVSGAVLGAEFGSIGGPMGAAIGAAIGLVAGIFSGNSANKAAKKAAEAQLEAAKARNKANVLEFARVMGEVSRERAIANVETTAALAYTKKSGATVNSQVQNAYASAEQTGNIVQYAKSSVAQDVAETEWQTLFNLETTYENLNAKIMSNTNSALGSYSGVQVQESPSFDVGSAIGSIMAGAGALAQQGVFRDIGGSSVVSSTGSMVVSNKDKGMNSVFDTSSAPWTSSNLGALRGMSRSSLLGLH